MTYTTQGFTYAAEAPTEEELRRLIARLEPIKDEPVVKAVLPALYKAHELFKEEAVEVVHQLMFSEAQPVVDIPAIKAELTRSNKELAAKVAKHCGRTRAQVDQILKSSTEPTAVAIALLEAAQGSTKASVKGAAEDVRVDMERLTVVTKRVADGGHPYFEAEIAKKLRRIWIALENGYDALAIYMRNHDIAFDPVYAARRKVKSPLFPELLFESPAEIAAREAAKAAGRSKKKGNPKPKKPTPAKPDPALAPQK